MQIQKRKAFPSHPLCGNVITLAAFFVVLKQECSIAQLTITSVGQNVEFLACCEFVMTKVVKVKFSNAPGLINPSHCWNWWSVSPGKDSLQSPFAVIEGNSPPVAMMICLR